MAKTKSMLTSPHRFSHYDFLKFVTINDDVLRIKHVASHSAVALYRPSKWELRRERLGKWFEYKLSRFR